MHMGERKGGQEPGVAFSRDELKGDMAAAREQLARQVARREQEIQEGSVAVEARIDMFIEKDAKERVEARLVQGKTLEAALADISTERAKLEASGADEGNVELLTLNQEFKIVNQMIAERGI